jgi:hypothetical protein
MNRDDTPSTWEAALPVSITLYEYGDDTKRVVISGFMRMDLEADSGVPTSPPFKRVRGRNEPR